VVSANETRGARVASIPTEAFVSFPSLSVAGKDCFLNHEWTRINTNKWGEIDHKERREHKEELLLCSLRSLWFKRCYQ